MQHSSLEIEMENKQLSFPTISKIILYRRIKKTICRVADMIWPVKHLLCKILEPLALIYKPGAVAHACHPSTEASEERQVDPWNSLAIQPA